MSVQTDMLPVAILAGGLATRLRPLTETIPKSLIEVKGEPFLAHQLRLLHLHGIREVVLCIGHLSSLIEEYAGDGSRFGMAVRYSPDGPNLRGTAGALRNALPLLGERFFILYGDSYLLCDYQAAQERFMASGKLGLMTVFQNEGQWDTSNVEYADGRILAYDKRERTPRMRHIDYGLGVLHRDALTASAAEGSQDLATVYQQLLQQNQLAAFEVSERFYEIGSHSGLDELSRVLAS